MTCKDCIHIDVCNEHERLMLTVDNLYELMYQEGVEKSCKHFKNKSDYAEVKHGKWIYHECVSSYDGAISGYSCSNCSAFVNEEMFDSAEFHRDYCGNCGKKMDGRSET